MKLQASGLLFFNKHFTRSVCNYVHSSLDKEQIPHFIHSITDSSVMVCIEHSYHIKLAEEVLMSLSFAKSLVIHFDYEGRPFFEIYF